ncbi:hypothetical protein, partial [Streptomyces sp. MUSC 125]|uniref:hypothetical protein n=1 Tax=Streptomyces sp. MUSC 125 TaxID=1428624 RepID=UPI0022771CD5
MTALTVVMTVVVATVARVTGGLVRRFTGTIGTVGRVVTTVVTSVGSVVSAGTTAGTTVAVTAGTT